MSKRRIIDDTEIHEGTANVYRDLGYPDAEEMLVKAQLVSKISEIIRGQALTQGWTRPGFWALPNPSSPASCGDNFAGSPKGN